MHLGVFKFVSKPCCAINYNTIQFKSRPNAKKTKVYILLDKNGKANGPIANAGENKQKGVVTTDVTRDILQFYKFCWHFMLLYSTFNLS